MDAGKATISPRWLHLEILNPANTEKPIGSLEVCFQNGDLGITNRAVADCAQQDSAEDVDMEGKHGVLHGRTWASKLPKISLNMGGLRLKARSVPEEIQLPKMPRKQIC